MGGQQSRTRKLTVENDDPTSVIKVSDDVVQRIKNTQDSRPAPETVSQPLPQQPPPLNQPLYIYEPSVTSLQLRQASLAELKKNDHYWENRLKNQQANHKMINDVLDCEYQRAMEEMDVKDESKKPKNMLPPCQDAKNAVMECYKENASAPMQCSKLVQAFQQCVDAKRATIIASRG